MKNKQSCGIYARKKKRFKFTRETSKWCVKTQPCSQYIHYINLLLKSFNLNGAHVFTYKNPLILQLNAPTWNLNLN